MAESKNIDENVERAIEELLFEFGDENGDNGSENHKRGARSIVTREKQFYRRFTSERNLQDCVDWTFQEGCAYHIISGGDIDSLSFLAHILRQQRVSYLLMSTWCMALQDIEELDRYFERGRILRMDSYVGEIFKNSYSNEHKRLCEMHKKRGGARCDVPKPL